MMTLEELIPAWQKWVGPKSRMVRIRKSILENINLPEETKLFLNRAGLPKMMGYSDTMPTLPRLTELVSETGPLPPSFARYRVFIEDGCLMYLCLDEEENGQVVAVTVDPESEREVFFFHSSILHFAECCIAVSEIWNREIGQDYAGDIKEAWRNYIAKYEQVGREIDPPALANDRTWYARKVSNLKEEWLS